MPADNPFLTESPLPYRLPPFDKIKDDQFVPATKAGMREQLKEVDAIAANADKATFDNTVVALERTGRLLDRVQRTFSNLNAADTNPTRQKIETEHGAEVIGASRCDPSEQQTVRACSGTLFQSRQAGPRSGIGLFAGALLQGFRPRGREAFRFRQGEVEEDQCRAGDAADAVRTERSQGKERVSSIVVDRTEDLAGLSDNQMASRHRRRQGRSTRKAKFVIAIAEHDRPAAARIVAKSSNCASASCEASLSRNSKGGEFDTREHRDAHGAAARGTGQAARLRKSRRVSARRSDGARLFRP